MIPEVQALVVELWVAMDVRHLAWVAPAQHRRCDQVWRDWFSNGAGRDVGDHRHVPKFQMGLVSGTSATASAMQKFVWCFLLRQLLRDLALLQRWERLHLLP